jgi:hypothetical protein
MPGTGRLLLAAVALSVVGALLPELQLRLTGHVNGWTFLGFLTLVTAGLGLLGGMAILSVLDRGRPLRFPN